jgi:murein DD-endopeptidase MepM/ murein hydrolase activator NlpD
VTVSTVALVLLTVGCPEREPAVAPLPPQPLRGIWLRAARGETVVELARRHGVSAQDVEELNGLERGAPVGEGRLVFVPGARAAGTRPAVAQRASSPVRATDPASRPVAEREPRGAGSGYVWPVPGGKVVSGFGLRGTRPHEGVDIAAAEGTAILATADGLVIYAGSGVRGYGNLVLVRHADGMVSVYAHNRRNLVTEKTRVRQGQVIAEVGHTGSASASHLHFELRRRETPIDPSKYVHP